jgi:hypothetical protein
MNHLPVVASTLALMMAACGGNNPSQNPVSPSVPPDQTFTVSGLVVGQGGAPIEGAKIFVAGKQGTTDGNGYFGLPEVPRSYGGASAVKAGYAAAREILTVSGDTRHDFQLGPRVAIYTLSGVVSEETPTGLVPLEGVLVEEYSCEDVSASPPFFSNACPVSVYQTTITDKNGAYSFSGLYAGKRNNIGAAKDGFEDPLAPDGPEDPNAADRSRTVTINGASRYDIQLVRR